MGWVHSFKALFQLRTGCQITHFNLPELRPDQGGQGKSGSSSWSARDKKWASYRAHVADVSDAPSGYEEDTTSMGPSSHEMAKEELELVPEELKAATHAALAALNASQSRLRAIKQARGCFSKTQPSVNPERKERLKKLMAENPCRASSQLRHRLKDPKCPRNQNRSASSAFFINFVVTEHGDHFRFLAQLFFSRAGSG